jgi:hypothetical protein
MIARRVALCAFAALVAFGVAPAAQAQSSNPYYRHIYYSLDTNFNATEKAIIQGALDRVAHRFLDPRMFDHARLQYRHWSAAAPGYTLRTASDFETWFTQVQRRALLERGFPVVRIRGVYDAAGSWTGRATLNKVLTQYRWDVRAGRSVAYVSGQFEITLNTAKLGNASLWYGRDVDYWAGTIAHEMLHNLGHHHPENVYDGLFIRAYENAVRFNADPRR